MKKLQLLILAILSLTVSSFAQTTASLNDGIKLLWDYPQINSGANSILNFRILIGTSPGSYTESKLVSNRVPTTNDPVVLTVNSIGNYYLAVTAIDDLGLESEPSNELAVRVIDLLPPSKLTLSVVQGYVPTVPVGSSTNSIIKTVN
jgi:hypothetical protein